MEKMLEQKKPLKNPVIIPEKIHLVDIRLISAQINSDRDRLNPKEELDLSFDTISNFNLEENYCNIHFTISYDGINETTGVNAKFTFQFGFIVDNMNDFFVEKNEENGNFIMNANLGMSLIAIVYSTSRGIIFTRTAGTVLEGMLLPVIDVSKLIK